MANQSRRQYSAEFKAKVALEAAKEQFTLAELAKKYDISIGVISRWKGELLENMATLFSKKKSGEQQQPSADVEKLYAMIGQQNVEIDFLKKVQRKLGI